MAPTGSNASSCTVGAPCTLDKADSLAAPGTTVRVAAGSYSMTNLRASGTPTARIRWVSDTRWGAKLSATGSGPLHVVTVNGAYVDFQGFEVTGSGGSGTAGIDVEGSYSRAIGNHVHDLAIPCGGNGGAGIDLSGNQLGHDQQAIGNLVTDIGSGPRNGTCRTIHGIYASVPGVVIENNITARAVGDGISSYHYATALMIANNTSTQNGGFGILLGGSVSPFNRGSYVVNNIATSNYLGGIVDCCSNSPPQGGHYLNNLTYGNGVGGDGPRFEGTPAEVSGTVHLDPLFVDAAADNYHLRSGSPAIDSGTANRAPSNDFDGMLRPRGAGFDRGAYEF